MSIRKLARRAVPAPIRLRRKLWLRSWRDWRAGLSFATQPGSAESFPFEWCSYKLPFIDYPGQEQLGRAKRANQARLASYLTDIIIGPGEVFSVWKLAPRPDIRHGYSMAAALRYGVLTTETGGAICLLSTVLYNAALLSGMEIRERHCHSVDSYGESRYFELGRDAAIEYGYLDLRFLNNHQNALLLRIDITEDYVRAALFGVRPMEFDVSFEISTADTLAPLPGDAGRYRVRTTRIVDSSSGKRMDDLGWSIYRRPPAAASQPIAPNA